MISSSKMLLTTRQEADENIYRKWVEIMNNKEFIINGKLYSTEDSLLLCRAKDACSEEIAVYHTKKGAFFSVRTPLVEKTEVKVIDRQAALKILGENPDGIINENYIKVFGKVDRG